LQIFTTGIKKGE